MRYTEQLKRRYQTVAQATGVLVLGVAGLLLLPLALLPAYPAESGLIGAFLGPALLAAALGEGLRRWGEGETVHLGLPEASVVVVAAWSLAIVLGALPFWIAGRLGAVQAVFESLSGWTTTGLSVLAVEGYTPLILFWRSLLQFAGGAGLAVMMLAALVGPAGAGVYEAEGHSEMLVPNVRRSAWLVIQVYLGWAAVGIVALRTAGMSWFDALNHAMAALSTGGFSTRWDSIGFWQSPAVEVVICVLMVVGATNFATQYAVVRGRLSALWQSGEIRLGAGLTLAAVAGLVAAGLPLRVAAFQTVSALSTSGFSTQGYQPWPDVGVLVLTGLMLVGGGICSTAGGLKLLRLLLLVEGLVDQVVARILPTGRVRLRRVVKGDEVVEISPEQLREAGSFFFLYAATWAAGVLALVAQGVGLRDAMFEYASCVGTVGLSIGVTGPATAPGILVTEMAGMFLGRMEFFVVLYAAAGIVRDLRDLRESRAEPARTRAEAVPGIRPARAEDLPAVRSLLEHAGLPLEGLESGFPRDYMVADAAGAVVGVAGLARIGTRCLLSGVAVMSSRRRQGLGRRLVEDRIALAGTSGSVEVWLVAASAPGFFSELGFVPVERAALPADLAARPELGALKGGAGVCMVLALARPATARGGG